MTSKPVIKAIFLRDLRSWFTNPTGYVFIALFVLLCAFALFVPPRFFQENTASLAPLQDWFRILLLFFVPAVTMMVWAGERGQGTDEILLTLPAPDHKIVLGKFFAACGVYTLSLAFSCLLPFYLERLGDPDWGLIFTTYLAFWALGVFLISVGMVGSLLTSNLTVAFILGAVFCGATVFLEDLLAQVRPDLWRSWQGYGPVSFFNEMARGQVTLPAIVFFTGATAAFLYLNTLLLSRRRWVAPLTGLHFTIRLAAIVVGLISLTTLTVRANVDLDMTDEGLHTLTDETKEIVEGLSDDRPVTIRAWVSPEVPTNYVPVRRDLLDLLRQYDKRGGDAIHVEVIDTERYSAAASDAEKNFGIRHRTAFAEEGTRRREFDIYMGVAVTSGPEEVVIPFLDRGLSVEYELTRSIRVVSGATRPKIGVLETDAKMFGGFDMQTYRPNPVWEIVRELKLQYEVVPVDPKMDYPGDLKMLLVAMASSLTQEEMDRLGTAIRSGVPTLLLDDPFPNSRPDLAPSAPKGGQRNPMMGRPPPGQPQKGNYGKFYRDLGIAWDPRAVAWDDYNPHPEVPAYEEWVFVGAQSGASEPFAADSVITSGLQEVLIWFGGVVMEDLNSPLGRDLTFQPLLRTTKNAGTLYESQIFQRNMFGQPVGIDPNRPRIPRGMEMTLACRVTGKLDADAAKDIDVIFIPDLDMIHLPFLWQFRREGHEDFRFDNVTFLLNCVDSLIGDTTFIELRKRRPRDRTLTTIEEREAVYKEAWRKEKKAAEDEAEEKRKKAQERLDERVEMIKKRTDLDERAKAIQIETVQGVEQRLLNNVTKEIDDEKQRKIGEARRELNDSVDAIQNKYRLEAVISTPVLAILAGIAVFLIRLWRERSAVPERRSVEGGEA